MTAGEVIRSDCPHGYLQSETGVNYLCTEYEERMKDTVQLAKPLLTWPCVIFMALTSVWLMVSIFTNRGSFSWTATIIAFLIAFVASGALIIAGAVTIQKDMHDPNIAPLLFTGLLLFIATLVTIRIFCNEVVLSFGAMKLDLILLVSFIILSAWYIFRYPLKKAGDASSDYKDALQEAKSSSDNVFNTDALQMYLKASVGNTLLSSKAGTPDQSITENDIRKLVGDENLAKYFKHRAGREFDDIERMMTDTVSDEDRKAIEDKINALRTEMAQLRDMNAKTVKEFNQNTGVTMVMLALVVTGTSAIAMSYFAK